MLTYRHIMICAALAAGVAFNAGPSAAQPLTGAPVAPELKFSTPMPQGVVTPDTVETRFGTLRFFDGVPDQSSTDKIYDNLDYQRAVQAYLLALPAVNQLANRRGILAMGPANTTVPIWEQMVDSRTVELTANDNTPYTWFWIDLRNGPLVIEAPPKVLGLTDDMWYDWIGDIGFTVRGAKVLVASPITRIEYVL